MQKVAVLSDALINKIAAGEVVERPASVIKELVENALDAGARSIRVALRGGGLGLISITDDGHGMSRPDAILAMTRHATSKLRDLDGLFCIRTMGFRGEALPAIASVSRFSLVTSEQGADVGTAIEVEGGGALRTEDAAPVGGTRIRVEDLFFNTPARRKFMRAEQTELGHCEEAVIRIALAHPEVAFSVEHEGRMLLTSPACPDDLRERIAAALGSEVHPHLVPAEERRLGITVRGFIAKPEYTLSNARGIYTFVNQRYIRDRALNASIQRAYSDVLPGGRQPVVVLFIDVDPREVDVNVHPQKLEVRFADQRGVADAVFHAIVRTLREVHAAQTGSDEPRGAAEAAQYASAVERFLARATQGVAEGASSELHGPMQSPFSSDAPRAPAFGEARPGINEAPPQGFFGQLRYLGTLGARFWICEGQGGTLVVIDPHAAWERARLERFSREAEATHSAEPERSLFGATIEFPRPEAQLLSAQVATLRRLGFEVEPFGGTSLAIRSIPSGLEGAEVRTVLTDLCAALPPVHAGDANAAPSAEALAPALAILACHAARNAPVELNEETRRALFRELDEAAFHRPCRHGRVVNTELPLLELERRARGLEREHG